MKRNKKYNNKSYETDEQKSSERSQVTEQIDRLPANKKLLFRIIAVSIPLSLIVILEIILRLYDYGGYPSFIMEAGTLPSGEKLCIVEPAASKPYFFNNYSRPGYADQSSFLMPKPENTIRIFLIGESAAKGYPQPKNLSMSSFLQSMLSDLLPDKKIEVINLGTTAIASFPIIYMVKDALKYQPDLFISYTGNNEFFGAYGTASINSTGIIPPVLLPFLRWLNGLAIVQALYELTEEKNIDISLMEQMIGQIKIPFDASIRKDAAENLEYNLSQIAEELNSAEVPLILCTTASNESGLAPLGEEFSDSFNQQTREKLFRNFTEGKELISQNPKLAIEKLLTALSIAPEHAATNFYLGKAYASLGDYSKARNYFLAARKFDTMPWRPVDLTESAIRNVAKNYGVVLCDIANAFRDSSKEGATGWDLMDDHVHLSLKGQAEAGRLMLKSMTKLKQFFTSEMNNADSLPDADYYAEKLGSNIYDDYRVNHTLRVLFNIPFMRNSNPQAYNRFNSLVEDAEREMTASVLPAVREWQTMKPHAGGLRPIAGMVARVMIREKRLSEALLLYEIAQKQVPDYTSWFLEYKYFALAAKEQLNGSLSEPEKNEATDVILQGKFLLNHGYSETGLTERYIGRLYQLRGEWNEAVPFLLAARTKLRNEDLIACDQALVMSYIRLGKRSEAINILNTGIRFGGKYSAIYRQILQSIQ